MMAVRIAAVMNLLDESVVKLGQRRAFYRHAVWRYDHCLGGPCHEKRANGNGRKENMF